jgi:hypothetical protein
VPNPFTKAIAARLQSKKLAAFIDDWDALEALVIDIFRAKEVTTAQLTYYQTLRATLLARYTALRDLLDAHWRAATINREAVTTDPFLLVLEPDNATAFVDNWAVLQNLPAAREALNALILKTEAAR